MSKRLLTSSALALSLAFLPLHLSAVSAYAAEEEPAAEAEATPEAEEPERAEEEDVEAAEEEPDAPDEPDVAEDEPETEPEVAEEEPDAPPSGFIAEQEPDWQRTEAIKNMTVYTVAEESLGGIQDLILDDHRQVIGAVLGVGGFLGIGQKRVALSWDMFEPGAEPDTLVVQTTREELDAAPEFRTLEDIEAEREAETMDPAVDPTLPAD